MIIVNKQKEEKILFSEIFYKNDKKFFENRNREIRIELFSVIFGLSFLIFILFLCFKNVGLFNVLTMLVISTIILISWLLLLYINMVKHWLTYIRIDVHGVKIISGNKKIRRHIPKENINKIIINLKKKRIEIHMKDGDILYLKRPHRREIEQYILTYEQFERFKKAMKEIGVEYEVIYA